MLLQLLLLLRVCNYRTLVWHRVTLPELSVIFHPIPHSPHTSSSLVRWLVPACPVAPAYKIWFTAGWRNRFIDGAVLPCRTSPTHSGTYVLNETMKRLANWSISHCRLHRRHLTVSSVEDFAVLRSYAPTVRHARDCSLLDRANKPVSQ